MSRCFNCGTENAEGTKYCNNCGALLAVPQPAEPIDDDIPMAQAIPQPQQTYMDPTAPAGAQPQPKAASASSAKPASEKNDPLCMAGLIVSLVSILCCGMTSIVGLGLSIGGLIKVKKSGQKGSGLAIAGIIISGVFVLVFIFSYISGTFNRLTGKTTETTATTTTEVTTEATTTTKATTEETTKASGIRPEVKKAIDDYEEFYDEYCAFLKRYSESNYSASMLGDYMTMIGKLAEYEESWDALDDSDFTDEEADYYFAANTRISAKILEAEGYMMGQL